MFCNLLTRLFRRRRQVPDGFTAPALRISAELPGIRLPHIPPTNDTQTNAFDYLGCLAEQGTCTLIVSDIPQAVNTDLESHCRQLLGFISGRYEQADAATGTLNFLVSFSTAVDASMALATQSTIILNDGTRRNLRPATESEDTTEPARKRAKIDSPTFSAPKCDVCCEELTGMYSKPCYHCKSPRCLDCLRNQFSVALKDQEMFPVKCCKKFFHFDVVRSIISSEDYTKYRARFEQHNTTKPVYCANAKCSAFLPLRISRPNRQGQVLCPDCESITCMSCRVVVKDQFVTGHKCIVAGETLALLNQFEYKRCPRCSTGVARMFGCSHIRCPCGAHWCWDCERPIQICWVKPCERAQEDGETENFYGQEEEVETDTDSSSLQETASQTIEPQETQTSPQVSEAQTIANAAGATGTQPTETEALAVTQTSEPANDSTIEASVNREMPADLYSDINLDAEDADNWEGGDFDFGAEPFDEPWDTWGCMHHFEKVELRELWQDRKHWLPDVYDPTQKCSVRTKQIDCLRCYTTMMLTEPTAEAEKGVTEDGVSNRADSACDVTISAAAAAADESPSVSAEAITKVANGDGQQRPDRYNRVAKRQRKQVRLYCCRKCGVFHCAKCKKAAGKEIHTMLDQRTTI